MYGIDLLGDLNSRSGNEVPQYGRTLHVAIRIDMVAAITVIAIVLFLSKTPEERGSEHMEGVMFAF